MKSNLTLEYLDETTVADACKLRVDELAALDEQIAEAKATLKARQDKLHAALVRRYGEEAQAMIRDHGKDTGTAHCTEDGWDVTVSIPKKVTWDQQKLMKALDAMPEEQAKHYARVVVSVEENKYKAAPPDIQKALSPARTVKPGNPSFSFKLVSDEVAA